MEDQSHPALTRSARRLERPSAETIADQQRDWTSRWHVIPGSVEPPGDPFRQALHDNHRANFDLWHQEDRARRDDKGAEYVYRAKRAIDTLNQARNDAMERIDDALLTELPTQGEEAPLHSETPGMIIDRLSILSLKEYHMEEEAGRQEASPEHRARCAARLEVIQTQRRDLTACLERLLNDVTYGRRRFKLYRQFKMYNDPSLNPELYQES